MTAIILRGDAAHLPLPDESVDLICTSPPYWGLRSYVDAGEHYDGQIGSEATPGEYIAALLRCTREWMRVLKPQGSLFVNIGDAYSKRADGSAGRTYRADSADALQPSRNTTGFTPRKSLLGLPWRYAIRCVDDLGLILRAEIIWDKPNGLPESVTDRVRRSHEQVFHFTRHDRYYAGVDEIREPHTMRPQRRPGGRPADLTPRQGQPRQSWSTAQRDEQDVDGHPLGKLPGSVWEIASQPLAVPESLGLDHFAAFPMGLPRRIILGWSPSGICTECGEGRRPVVAHDNPRRCPGSATYGPTPYAPGQPYGQPNGGSPRSTLRQVRDSAITGYACACPQPDAPVRPSVVADPFGGTGTTALVADVLGRTGISVDKSADYCRLARWRTTDPGERARALGVPKPAKQVDGQGSLFDGLEAS